ncbi:MAG: TonB-dependent receptor [Bacteroidota bacterium]
MKIARFKYLLTFLVIFNLQSYAQDITQTIRGSVKDKVSQITLPGATVAVYIDSSLIKGAATDIGGYFRIEDIPLGRYTIVASFLGYRQIVIPNVIVNTGKEVIIPLEMEESVVTMQEVVVAATPGKGAALNEMSTVSARTFSVEETERYAGSRADPARMASNFAGVQGADDSRNDIVVRGNTPMGLLWRLEGVNIPNPNHFDIPGSTGGPVSILNNKVLATSDFITGAFPAEYGNSIAGVFDLRMRNGNDEKHEFTGQFGFLGTELTAEGPISKKNRSSYLATYRYSTLSMFSALGIDIGTTAIPVYQDLSFKVNFPIKNNSNISLFGIGGKSDIDIIVSDQVMPERDIYGDKDRDQYFGTSMGVIGINYSMAINTTTFARVTISASNAEQQAYHELVFRHIELQPDSVFVIDSLVPKLGYSFKQSKISASVYVNKKLNRKHTIKAGFFDEQYRFNFLDSNYNETTYQFEDRWNHIGTAYLIQPYLQWKYRISDDITINAGLHSQYFTLNKSYSPAEPRLGIEWKLRHRQVLSFGFGMHSQLPPTYTYFYHFPASQTAHNTEMGFINSNHYVLSYDNSLSNNLRIKTEVYYQQLYNVPVESSRSSSFSLLNQGSGFNRFFPDTLANTGTGENYGIELTLEKFFSRTYFFMLTASLYESKYKGSDGVERDTDFGGNYAVNLLSSKKFRFGKKKNTVLGLGCKITSAGGKRYAPVDTLATEIAGEIIYVDSLRNSLQFRDYFRADIKINFKANTKKFTHEIGLDLVNILKNKNVLKLTYISGVNNPVREEYQLGFMPVFYYKVDF